MIGKYGRRPSRDVQRHLLLTGVMATITAAGLIALPIWAQDPRSAQPALESSVVVPDILNKTVREARRALQAVGLTLELDRAVEDDTRAVIKLQRPPAGNRVRPGSVVQASTIIGPPALVSVPDVTGRTMAEARNILEREGLVVELEGTARDTGYVRAQSPSPGVRVRPGTRVSLTVARPAPDHVESRPPIPPPPPAAVPPAHPPAPVVTPRRERPSPTPKDGGGEGGTATVDEILARLELANVAFNAPTQLQLHEVSLIQLLLSTKESIEALQSALTAAGERSGARARISNQMEAHLSGTGFRVEPITPERQAVSAAERTEWRWQIEPTQTGTLHLDLTLSADLQVDGQSVPRMIQTFERTIEVKVTWPAWTKAFLAGNWQWLWTAILIPVCGWIYRNRKRRGARRKPR